MNPGEKLISLLEQLRHLLNKSGVERTFGLGENLGTTCEYYRKSMSRFVDQDYVNIRNLVWQIEEQIDVVEGRNW